MKAKTIRNAFRNAIYILGAILAGAVGVFIFWAVLWIGYFLGFTM